MSRETFQIPANDNIKPTRRSVLVLLSPIIDGLARQAVRQIPAPANDNVEMSGESA